MSVSVLVVDDNVTLRWATCQQLARLGVECDSAANGQEALDRLKRWRYHLILMDVEMPVMSGYEATRQIRAHETRNELAPVIIVGFTGLPDRQACIDAGMSDYTQKPVMLDGMRELLSRWRVLKAPEEKTAFAISEQLHDHAHANSEHDAEPGGKPV